jgi:hypothetical protein
MRRIEDALDNSRSLRHILRGNCERMRTKIMEEAQRIAEIINRER